MRMARVNITVPDDVLARARAAGVNVSRVSSRALTEELDRRLKIAALERYLDDLESESGPVPEAEAAAARQWADRLVPGAHVVATPTRGTA